MKTQSSQDTAVQPSGPEVGDGLVWHDARSIGLRGQGWPGESPLFARLPERAKGVVREAVWNLSLDSAGLHVDFSTDATTMEVRFEPRKETNTMDHMPAIGKSSVDLYARHGEQWRFVGAARAPQYPEYQGILLREVPSAWRHYRMNLPLYNGMLSLQVGVPDGATLTPAPPDPRRPICFYGTSITQGGCASRPGMAYTSIVSRRLDWPVVNLGFSGNGKSEPELAELLAELDPEIYVLDALANMSLEEVNERLEPFITRLREAHPQTPIVMMEHATYARTWMDGVGPRGNDRNEAMRAIVARLQAGGMENLHIIEGSYLTGDDDEGTVDGGHPTDLGFYRMAGVIEPVLAPLLPR